MPGSKRGSHFDAGKHRFHLEALGKLLHSMSTSLLPGLPPLQDSFLRKYTQSWQYYIFEIIYISTLLHISTALGFLMLAQKGHDRQLPTDEQPRIHAGPAGGKARLVLVYWH